MQIDDLAIQCEMNCQLAVKIFGTCALSCLARAAVGGASCAGLGPAADLPGLDELHVPVAGARAGGGARVEPVREHWPGGGGGARRRPIFVYVTV